MYFMNASFMRRSTTISSSSEESRVRPSGKTFFGDAERSRVADNVAAHISHVKVRALVEEAFREGADVLGRAAGERLEAEAKDLVVGPLRQNELHSQHLVLGTVIQSAAVVLELGEAIALGLRVPGNPTNNYI